MTPDNTPTAAALREQAQRLTARRDRLHAEARAVAFDRAQFERLDGEASELEREVRRVTAALPLAEQREATAKAAAEATALATRIAAYDATTADAATALAEIVGRLATADELNRLRDFMTTIRAEASWLHAQTNDTKFRRPMDPLHVLRGRLLFYIERIDRGRYGAITLDAPDAIREARRADAVARVSALEAKS